MNNKPGMVGEMIGVLEKVGNFLSDAYFAADDDKQEVNEQILPCIRAVLAENLKPGIVEGLQAVYAAAKALREFQLVWERADTKYLPTAKYVLKRKQLTADLDAALAEVKDG